MSENTIEMATGHAERAAELVDKAVQESDDETIRLLIAAAALWIAVTILDEMSESQTGEESP